MIISILIPPPHQDRFQVQAKCQLQNFTSVADMSFSVISKVNSTETFIIHIFFGY